ncbi:MAG: sulfate adenylyltransferase [Candidatus Heimdallarchaeota archaeon]|nr:sulfate adenylyltransferase [Candidatus Heimdallarchaeota archaeon]
MINPHGNKLVNRIVDEQTKEKWLTEYHEMPQLSISSEALLDVQNIAHGVFSPLEGFMLEEDVQSIIQYDRLPDDLPWTIPIVLDVTPETAEKHQEGEEIALVNGDESLIGVLSLEEIFDYDKKGVATSVFQTLDVDHPGVKKVMNSKEKLFGGKISLVDNGIKKFNNCTLYPLETRLLFKEKDWNTVVGFQTRNVPHLGHEYVQKAALTFMDGLFINPIIGKKKKNDFLDSVIVGAYNVLIQNYYRKDKATMSILRTRMRYAGPKEAIFHALIRKNFGCTHFIVGRDHAGVGNYYGPFDAHEIFREFPDLGIEPVCFRSFFKCKKCQGVVNDSICPHDGTKYQDFISGSKIRQMIKSKQLNQLAEYMRPEVAQFLFQQKELFVK